MYIFKNLQLLSSSSYIIFFKVYRNRIEEIISYVQLQVHIVYLGEKQHDDPKLITNSHHEMLADVVGRYKGDILS